jgi:hypothetical protein
MFSKTKRSELMGMYTEFYFRANVKDGDVADWLDRQINGGEWFDGGGYDGHEFFTLPRWDSVLRGGGAVYQESRVAIFRRKHPFGGEPYRNQLVLASSLKNYGDEINSFVEWISPHLDMHVGDFLGYSLYEDSCDDEKLYREHPVLFFYEREPVWGA